MKPPAHPTSLIEPLEARIAPAGLLIRSDGRGARWTDVDGDTVTLTSNKPVLGGDNFFFIDPQPGDVGQQLAVLDFRAEGLLAKGISLNFTAVRTDGLGDGSVNIGLIEATGIDLGAVNLPGDLGAIHSGDAVLTTPAVASLTVFSGGALGVSTQGEIDGTLGWYFLGRIGPVTVKGDFYAMLDVRDSSEPFAFNKDASTGPITIWGDLVGGGDSFSGFEGAGTGYIFAEGNLGPVKILGDIYGGSATGGGAISSLGAIPSLTLGQSLRGGSASDTGRIAAASIGTVKIEGSIIGGEVPDSGLVTSFGALTSVSVGGSIFGGDASNTGHIFAYGQLGSVTVGQSVRGGYSPRDAEGLLLRDENAQSVLIVNSGAIGSYRGITSVKIGGDLVSGEGIFAGAVFTDIRPDETDAGVAIPRNIKSVSVGGTLRGVSLVDDGEGNFLSAASGIYAFGQIGTVTVGAAVGANSFNPVSISALGKASPTKTSEALAIASVTVLRGALNLSILAGLTGNGTPVNPDVQIGAIKIGNSFIGSSVSAGVSFGDTGWGGPTGALAAASAAFDDDPLIRSRIASFTVGSYVIGNPSGVPEFVHGIVAQEIGAVKLGTATVALTRNTPPATDNTTLDLLSFGITRAFFVREVA